MAADEPCVLWCQIADPEHIGDCDSRTEHERALDLYALLDEGVSDEDLARRHAEGAQRKVPALLPRCSAWCQRSWERHSSGHCGEAVRRLRCAMAAAPYLRAEREQAGRA